MKIVRGAHIASQFVNASHNYASQRTIDVLSTTAGLSRTAKALANEIDRYSPTANEGEMLSGHADGKISSKELMLLESDANRFGALDDDARAALKEIWNALIMPEAAAVTSALDGLDALNLDTVTHSAQHAQMSKPSRVIESELPAHMREWARRIQLQHDDDADPSTISLADTRAMLDEGGCCFTRSQVDLTIEIHTRLLDDVIEQLDSVQAKASVPGLGTTEISLGSAGTTEVAVVENRRLIESRSAAIKGDDLTHLKTQLSLKVDRQLQLNVPADHKGVVFIGDQEIVLHPGPNRVDIDIADDEKISIALFNDSGPVELTDVKLPWFGKREEDLTAYLGYTFTGADDEGLHRNLVEVSSGGGEPPAFLAPQLKAPPWMAVHFEYDSAAKRPSQPSSTIPADLLDRLTSPSQPSALPPGRYKADVSIDYDGRREPLFVDVFASGLAQATFFGKTSTLRPCNVQAEGEAPRLMAQIKFRRGGRSEKTLHLLLEGNKLSHRGMGGHTSMKLATEDRVV